MSNVQVLQEMIITSLTASGSTITEEDLSSKAKSIRTLLSSIYPISDADFNHIIRKIQETLPVRMDIGVCIQDRKNNYTPWYNGKSAQIKSVFWARFRKYLLQDKCWSQDVVNTIDKVSDRLVGLLGDPDSEQPFSRKGLVLGDVQSGKTVNFTAVCNKAVDAGYRVIILLAGTIETLRKQTQDRMDLEFAGINSYNQFHKIKEDKSPGVSRYDKNGLVVSFTTNKSDFNANALQINNMSLHTVAPKVPIFFVVKKNVRILENLLTWLKNKQNIGSNGKIDLSVLLLDDEADNASVNVNDEDSDPAKTNAKIRELLKLFSKVSYLAITATPFANIFIDPDTEDEMYEDDLFPRDFIYALSPPFSTQPLRSYNAYIGAPQIFGDAPIGDMLIPLEDIENILPKKHKTGSTFPCLPESLKEAIAYFCLANAVRDLRGDTITHRSMLIHISHLKSLHKCIEEKVSRFFLDIKYATQNYAQLQIDQAMQIEEIIYLKSVWDKYNFERLAECQWRELLSGWLFKAIAPIVVQVVNSGGGSLDYEGNKKDGLRVIAIGGNCLSRGLTLEGLMVSYFRRNTMMYDTLLQMGRWFGFRPSYADLCKIWLPDESREWFEQITESYIELKNEIYLMQEQGKSPKDFGLKVRMHPGALLPTARNKMRSIKDVPRLRRPISISGRLLETPRLLASAVAQTEATMKNFVLNLDTWGTRVSNPRCRYFWQKVSSEHVATFIRDFPTDPWSTMFRGSDIATYIGKHPNLWDVAIMEGEGSIYPFNNSINPATEERTVTEDDGVLKISGKKVRVGAGGAAKVGLTQPQIDEIECKYAERRRMHPELEMGKGVPDNWYFCNVNRPPILMLHVIEKKNAPRNFLFAIGTGFPGSKDHEEYAEYIINLVEWRQYDEKHHDSISDNPQEIQ